MLVAILNYITLALISLTNIIYVCTFCSAFMYFNCKYWELLDQGNLTLLFLTYVLTFYNFHKFIINGFSVLTCKENGTLR